MRQNKEKLEKFDKAFKELDEDAIKSFIEERHMFTDIKKINNDYSIAMLYDPYGDTGSRHAITKLIIKDKGIIDLKHHPKEFSGNAVTQGFDIEDIKLKYDGEKIFLDYAIKERQSGHSSSGSYWSGTLGTTKHTIEFDSKKLGLPVNKDMKLDYLIEKEKGNMLSHGNTNNIPIMMQGFGKEEPINYAYRMDKIENKDKTYLIVSKIIDMEHYSTSNMGTFAVEQQIKTEVYEAKGLEGKKPELKLVTGFTTDTNDRKKYVLNVEYNRERHEMKIAEPKIEIADNEISVTYKVHGNDVEEKEIHLSI